MIEDNTYEENVEDFNRMFNNLKYKDFNWDAHIMIDNIVGKIEFEYTMNCLLDDSNTIHINRFQDVLKWESYEKSRCSGGSTPPLSVLKERGLYTAPLPVTTSFKTPSFFTDMSGRRRRKKYL